MLPSHFPSAQLLEGATYILRLHFQLPLVCGFHPQNSFETAFLKITNDLLFAKSSGFLRLSLSRPSDVSGLSFSLRFFSSATSFNPKALTIMADGISLSARLSADLKSKCLLVTSTWTPQRGLSSPLPLHIPGLVILFLKSLLWVPLAPIPFTIQVNHFWPGL